MIKSVPWVHSFLIKSGFKTNAADCAIEQKYVCMILNNA